ncbi:MAG: hypothetical protein J1E34_08830 [Oscillospiraceae bacterium]|nr:hypothetical protein [Oscillospiraceae bacterium]
MIATESKVQIVKKFNAKRSESPDVERVHRTLSVPDKLTASAHRVAFIEAKGDKVKRRKAKMQSEKWAQYLIDIGKVQPEDKDILMGFLCPV